MPAEENKDGMSTTTAGAADAAQGQGQQQAAGQGAEGDKGQKPGTLEEALAELERARAALKQANNESAGRRKKLDDYEAAEKKRQEATLSETERLKAQLAEAQQQMSLAEQTAQRHLMRSALFVAASKANFANPEDAWQLGDLSTLTVDDDEVKGADEVIKVLVKAKPYLVRAAAAAAPNTNATSGRGSSAPADEKKIAEIAAQRYGVRPPT